MKRIAVSLAVVALVCISLASTVSAHPFSGKANGPTPIKVVHNGAISGVEYNTQQVLALPNITTRTVEITPSQSTPKVNPDANLQGGSSDGDSIGGHVYVTFVYYLFTFICTYGSSDIEVSPNANITMAGELSYGGGYVDGYAFTKDNVSYVADETGCWNVGSGTYRMGCTGVGFFPNGNQIDTYGSVTGKP